MFFQKLKCLAVSVAIIFIIIVIAVGCDYTKIKLDKEIEEKKHLELDGYRRLYYDFYMEELQKIEEHIEGVALLDLDLNGIYELIVYLPGASASGSCEIYTIEDNEVRAFSLHSAYVLNQTGVRGQNIPKAKNAIEVMFWANLPQGEIKEWQVKSGMVFIPYSNRKTGEKIFVLVSGNSAGEKDSWHSWYKFENLNGALSATKIFSFEKAGGEDSSSGKFETLDWLINNISVSEDEFKTSVVNFENNFNLEYETIDFDYSEYSIKSDELDTIEDNKGDETINADSFLNFLLEFKPGMLKDSINGMPE
jgi:hypothetical protein